jgi:cold shock CspA family protein
LRTAKSRAAPLRQKAAVSLSRNGSGKSAFVHIYRKSGYERRQGHKMTFDMVANRGKESAVNLKVFLRKKARQRTSLSIGK